jgi:hypothetical protein
MTSRFAKIYAIGQLRAPFDWSAKLVKGMVVFVVLKGTFDWTNRIAPDQWCSWCRIRASNGQQLVKIAYGKPDTVHVCENGRSWFPEL